MRTDRIVALIDMDCFYVQVHQREEPETWGHPCAVVQYTGGGVIAVNYEARAMGVSRGCRVPDCRDKCPGIRLFWVPEQRGKADLSKYRSASSEVFDILLNFDPKLVVERASIDEAYLELTELVNDQRNAFDHVPLSGISVAGTESNLQHKYQQILEEDERLITASRIIQMIRTQVKDATQFSCSAGVSYNKVLAKLCAGFQKPNGQSLLPVSSVDTVFEKTPIAKVRGFGGKLGSDIKQNFAIEKMLELKSVQKELLESVLGPKTAIWVYEMARGNEDEPVTSRSVNKSVGCGELIERLTEDRVLNDRTATNLTVHIRLLGAASFSKALPLSEYREQVVIDEMEKVIVPRISKDSIVLVHPILSLSLSAGRFVEGKLNDAVDKTPRISSFFTSDPQTSVTSFQASASTDSFIDSSAVPAQDQQSDSVDHDVPQLIDLSPAPGERGFFYRKTMSLIKKGSIKM